MKKKEKRKYTRSGKYSKHTQDNVQSNSKPLEEQISDNIQAGQPEEAKADNNHVIKQPYVGSTPTLPTKFTFEDLPLSIRAQVETALRNRKIRHLPDDSKERKQSTLEYWRHNESR
jgi:hypothetical protein